VSPSEAVAFYRLRAWHCLDISRRISDPASKATLVVMAQAWSALADQTAKPQQHPAQQRPKAKTE